MGCNKCDHCDKEGNDNSLRKCGQCKVAMYCDRKCQSLHWKKHKVACNNHMRSLLSTAEFNPVNTTIPQWTKEKEAYKKELRNAKKNVETHAILDYGYTAQGLVEPGKPLPEGVPANYHLKKEAEFCYLTGAAKEDTNTIDENQKLGNLEYEKEYEAYYDDLVKNKDEWMSFFDHPRNFKNARQTCGILGNLATIYRQRGNMFEPCDKVLDMEEVILKIYKRSIFKLEGTGIMELYDGLTEEEHFSVYFKYEYRFYLLRFYARVYNNRLDESIPYYREVLEYEVMSGLDDHLCMLQLMGIPLTLQSVKSLSNDQIMSMLNIQSNLFGGTTQANNIKKAQTDRMALMACAGCDLTENTLREFKGCSRCSNVFYCNRVCQKNHWKVHKKVCNK